MFFLIFFKINFSNSVFNLHFPSFTSLFQSIAVVIHKLFLISYVLYIFFLFLIVFHFDSVSFILTYTSSFSTLSVPQIFQCCSQTQCFKNFNFPPIHFESIVHVPTPYNFFLKIILVLRPRNSYFSYKIIILLVLFGCFYPSHFLHNLLFYSLIR